jgi:hypothetical protein
LVDLGAVDAQCSSSVALRERIRRSSSRRRHVGSRVGPAKRWGVGQTAGLKLLFDASDSISPVGGGDEAGVRLQCILGHAGQP